MSIGRLLVKAGKTLLKKVGKKVVKQMLDDKESDMKVGDTIVVTNRDGSRVKLKIVGISGNLFELSDGTVRDLS